MTLSWSFRRKLVYSGVVLLISLGCVAFIWFKFFSVTPTCFDHMQNGAETGVDCGGTCSLVCSLEARAPVVQWARVFPNGNNSYTAAAYVQNNNGETGARGVHYAFQFFDADNKLVLEKDGVADIPPVQTIPILEPNIDVGNRTVVRTLFSFSDTPVWQRVVHGSVPNIRIVSQTLTPDATKLTATLQNVLLDDVSRVTVIAVLFDGQGVARAASKSTIPLLEHKSTANVVFTWPQSVQGIERAEISILPSF